MSTFNGYKCKFDKEKTSTIGAEHKKELVELFDVLRLLENRRNAKEAVDETIKNKDIERIFLEVLEVGIKDLEKDISILKEKIGDRTIVFEDRERLLIEMFDEIVDYAHSGQEGDSRKLRRLASEEFSQDLIDYVENRGRRKDRLLEAIKTRVDGELVELSYDDLALKLKDDEGVIDKNCISWDSASFGKNLKVATSPTEYSISKLYCRLKELEMLRSSLVEATYYVNGDRLKLARIVFAHNNVESDIKAINSVLKVKENTEEQSGIFRVAQQCDLSKLPHDFEELPENVDPDKLRLSGMHSLDDLLYANEGGGSQHDDLILINPIR